ncbi:MAG: hypothetical protein ABFD57_04045 [Smithella sp.]|nr:hypothetical protein [Syntrophaceae bacterium]
MSHVNIYEKILIDPPCKNIYHRLGFKKKTTKITAQQQEETDIFIQEALSFITLKGCTRRIVIDKNDGDKVVIADNLVFESKQLARFLRECGEALLMGATAGSMIMEAIADQTKKGNLSAAVVYDATASEMTDAALSWLMDYFNNQLRRESKKLLPRRFSAGYADFKLENQKTIYCELEMQKIGVAINSNCILLPEKSVTAIAGICG